MSRRHLRPLVFVHLVIAAIATAGSGFRMTIVPVPPRCGSARCLNGAGVCSVDADCNVGTLSAAAVSASRPRRPPRAPATTPPRVS
jgi:hypothetical protein